MSDVWASTKKGSIFASFKDQGLKTTTGIPVADLHEKEVCLRKENEETSCVTWGEALTSPAYVALGNTIEKRLESILGPRRTWTPSLTRQARIGKELEAFIAKMKKASEASIIGRLSNHSIRFKIISENYIAEPELLEITPSSAEEFEVTFSIQANTTMRVIGNKKATSVNNRPTETVGKYKGKMTIISSEKGGMITMALPLQKIEGTPISQDQLSKWFVTIY